MAALKIQDGIITLDVNKIATHPEGTLVIKIDLKTKAAELTVEYND